MYVGNVRLWSEVHWEGYTATGTEVMRDMNEVNLPLNIGLASWMLIVYHWGMLCDDVG